MWQPGAANTPFLTAVAVTGLCDGCAALDLSGSLPGHFKNSDLYATAGSNFLKLTPGGPKSTESSPALWQGVVDDFNAITHNLPTGKGYSLARARTGEAFVLKNHVSGGYTRGWVVGGDANGVVIEYELVSE